MGEIENSLRFSHHRRPPIHTHTNWHTCLDYTYSQLQFKPSAAAVEFKSSRDEAEDGGEGERCLIEVVSDPEDVGAGGAEDVEEEEEPYNPDAHKVKAKDEKSAIGKVWADGGGAHLDALIALGIPKHK